MGKVIGPFTKEDWTNLRVLRVNIKGYPKDPKYLVAIEKEKSIYNDILKEYIEAA